MYNLRPDKHEHKHNTKKRYDINLNIDVNDSNKKYTCELATPTLRCYHVTPDQVYAYHETFSFTDGSVKTLQRRKVKKVYLPEKAERGVGSDDVLSVSNRKHRNTERPHSDQKKPTVKSVRDVLNENKVFLVNEKLSPIKLKTSTTTSPVEIRIEMGVNTDGNELLAVTTQIETESPKIVESKGNEQKKKRSKIKEKLKEPEKVLEKRVSSDSLVQHVHDLESPSDIKQSKTSIDPMENKLEREYRRIFSTKSKDKKPKIENVVSEIKTSSIFRRRFEALRRGLLKKEDSKKNEVLIKISSHKSVISHKDVSIASDPPSLEARSFSNTKVYSPFQMYTGPEKPIYKTGVNEEEPVEKETEQTKESLEWPQMAEDDSEYNGVKGMFRLWGKKFNLDDEKKKLSPVPSVNVVKDKPNKTKEKESSNAVLKEKKERRKFLFFKKNAKCKSKKSFETKKSVTAGRCEIKDGLVIKIGASTIPPDTAKSDVSGDIVKKQWLLKYLSHDRASTNSVRVRWNNKMYRTSSSTIFELMDNVYKDLVLQSKSEIISSDSSYSKRYNPRVKFAPQEFEAWMIANTVRDRPKEMPLKIKDSPNTREKLVQVTSKTIHNSIQRLCQKIQVVLHSKNNGKAVETDSSSEYVRIDIPKAFFVESSSNDSEKEAARDEEVYNVVEYDAVPETKVVKNANKNMDTGDHEYNDIQIIVNVKDSKDLEANNAEPVVKKPATQRDVIIQGSNVNVSKKCDVIGVGIITQRDMREMRNKPILKIREDLSDDESERIFQNKSKKCELAESYLQQYCRHWSPLAIDLFSWRTSDTNVRCSSEASKGSLQNLGDVPKCTGYDEYQTSAVDSSSGEPQPKINCEPCHTPPEDDGPIQESSFTEKILKRLKIAKADVQDKRYLPKDSFEVFRKRKLYAASNKSKWTFSSYGEAQTCPPPKSKAKAHDTKNKCSKKKTVFQKPEVQTKKNPCSKHVSLPDCETLNEKLARQATEKKIESILSFKGSAKCDVCKKDTKCPKHTTIIPEACAIPDPICKPKCEEDPHAPCSSDSSDNDKSPLQSPVKTQKTKTKKAQCKKLPKCETPPPSPPCLQKCLTPPSKKLVAKSPPPCESPTRCETPPPCETPHNKPQCPPPSPRRRSPKKKNKKGNQILAPCGKPCCSSSSCRVRSRSSNNDKQGPTTPPCCKKPSSLKLMPMCIHYPPCRKSQSIQISPQRCSAKNSPINTPPCSPQNNKKVAPCSVPPCSLKKKEEKQKPPPPPPRRCDTPPCRKPPPPKPVCDDEYPWPMKNQVSNSSLGSICQTCPPKPSKNKCMKKCPSIPKTEECPNKVKSDKECKPDCPSREKLSPCPSPLVCPKPKASKNAFNHSKMSGVHLKMKPSNRTCSEECLAWQDEEQQGVIRLNSRERINIRLKEQTPSTEEIRECHPHTLLKVTDEDGDTLYERRDYRQNCMKQSLLGDMFQTPNVNRLSTPTSLKNLENTDGKNEKKKSDMNIANLVEITFKLRVTQGDKTTEINIANENEKKSKTGHNEVCQTPQEVYVVNKHSDNKDPPPNDVNVRIVIKNYKPKSNIDADAEYQRDFSKKISEKFQTVSTAYSDVSLERNPDNVYSIHRTTIDLTSSNEKSKSELTNVESIDVTDTENVTTKYSSKQTVQDRTEKTESTNVSRYNSSSYCVPNDTRPDSAGDQSISESSAKSCEMIKPRNRREQKEMLKEVLKKANETELSDKIKIKQLKKMLQVILSDSQQHKMAITDNDLVKDVTLASLPDYLKGSESQYMANNSVFDSIKDKSSCVDGSCMCSKLAEKLKLCKAGEGNCCCCGTKTTNKETNCTMSNDSNVLFFNYMTEEVKIETPNMKRVSRKIESTSLSFSSRTASEGKNEENYVTEITNSTSLYNKNRSNETMKKHQRERNEKKVSETQSDVIKTAKILQSYEMKRAVLQMYARDSVDGDRLIASLPKFSVDKENEIHKYEELLDIHRKRNLLMRSFEY